MEDFSQINPYTDNMYMKSIHTLTSCMSEYQAQKLMFKELVSSISLSLEKHFRHEMV